MRWTGMMALVFRVIASSILDGSILSVSSSISTKRGVKPAAKTALAVATKVQAGTMISSPLCAPNS